MCRKQSFPFYRLFCLSAVVTLQCIAILTNDHLWERGSIICLFVCLSHRRRNAELYIPSGGETIEKTTMHFFNPCTIQCWIGLAWGNNNKCTLGGWHASICEVAGVGMLKWVAGGGVEHKGDHLWPTFNGKHQSTMVPPAMAPSTSTSNGNGINGMLQFSWQLLVLSRAIWCAAKRFWCRVEE